MFPFTTVLPLWVLPTISHTNCTSVSISVGNLDLCRVRCCCMPVLLVFSYTCELDPTTSARVWWCSSLVHSLVPWAGNDVFRQVMSPASARLGNASLWRTSRRNFHTHVKSACSHTQIFKRSSVTLQECACCRLDRFFDKTEANSLLLACHLPNFFLNQFASAVSHTCASGVHVHSQEEPVTPLPCSFALAATYPFAGPHHSGHSTMGDSTLVTLFGRVLHSVWVNHGPHWSPQQLRCGGDLEVACGIALRVASH